MPPAQDLPADSPYIHGEKHYRVEASDSVSSRIDEELRKEGQRRKEASKRQVKVMLLGQAESGKSTLEKQFQLYYASSTLDHERPTWRPIVYFNIIKAVRMILDELEYEFNLQTSSAEGSTYSSSKYSARVQEDISTLRLQLLPLTTLEDELAEELNGGISVSGGRTGVYVRAGWQALVTPNRNVPSSSAVQQEKLGKVATMAARQLMMIRDDIEALWTHPSVRDLLDMRQARLDECAPFFLDNIHRISEPDYLPSTDDILNVRLQTLGVVEHSYDIDLGGFVYNWLMYDVGQRHAWVPYFDDATAVIFLAPISAFDQYLEEDPRTNRIDDSLQLFTAICSNKLLKNSHLVLLLNKADLLKKKLEAGIKVRKYITSYGDRPNTYDEVSEYFRAHFIQVHRRKDISNRTLYAHFTSMLDIKATQSIIANVGDVIIRSHIASAGLA
ncbi:guanine nucleotide binding protein, alpha subunit [Pterulicium gracile]|uniref:Guanine nucleotide binding protein, alpha subunit n=1 Tax=Pterulicium gracile TaxID=1884261 RepID=A0A5C3QR75_9AGAR|nr:guanine nucleotide binding protein, alpha subunit [Pterula gracilis]